MSEIAATTAGVSTFNGRSGEVSLIANDISGAGGALMSSVPAASTTTPLPDGTAAVGTGTTWARADHVHPASGGGGGGGDVMPPGVTDGSNAAPGQVGEVISIVGGTGFGLGTAGATIAVASIALPAGDWEISGEAWFSISGVPTLIRAAVAVSGTTIPTAMSQASAVIRLAAPFTGASDQILALSPCRRNAATGANYNLLVAATFSSGTGSAGGRLSARRMR